MPAKPLRTALGSLLIQKQYQFSDRELVEQIRENPYFQFFIGLPGYKDETPFVPSLMVEFRKRLTEDILCGINEMIIAYNAPDDPTPGGSGGSSDSDNGSDNNSGTLILDATCAPQNIVSIDSKNNAVLRTIVMNQNGMIVIDGEALVRLPKVECV